MLQNWAQKPLYSDRLVTLPQDKKWGHSWDSERQGVSRFPIVWSKNDIAYAIEATVRNPERYWMRDGLYIGWRKTAGVWVEARFVSAPGIPHQHVAYPQKPSRRALSEHHGECIKGWLGQRLDHTWNPDDALRPIPTDRLRGHEKVDAQIFWYLKSLLPDGFLPEQAIASYNAGEWEWAAQDLILDAQHCCHVSSTVLNEALALPWMTSGALVYQLGRRRGLLDVPYDDWAVNVRCGI